MNTLVWNCQELGNPRTVNALVKVVRKEDPSLVFLIETKIPKMDLLEIKRKLDHFQGLAVPSVGKSGGLALLWKKDVIVKVQTFSERHIDAIISGGDKHWRFTRFYGNPETSKREESQECLDLLVRGNSLPWICIGDFNELMHIGEKKVGVTVQQNKWTNFIRQLNTVVYATWVLQDKNSRGVGREVSMVGSEKGWIGL